LLDAQTLIDSFGAYAVLGVAILLFFETSTIFGSFLPGDSLIFVLGISLAQSSHWYSIALAVPLLVFSATIGSQVGYLIGEKVGPRLFSSRKKNWLFNQDSIDKAHEIIEKYGPNALVVSRFVPVLRALVPMLVGIMGLGRAKFFRYNLIGALLWAGVLLMIAWGLGNIPLVKDHIESWVLGFIIVSSLPFPIELLRNYLKSRKTKKL
jgi:membrane-associated protein